MTARGTVIGAVLIRIVVLLAGTILMATDLEVGMRVHVDGVEVEVPGSALLSVAQFGSLLRESTATTLLQAIATVPA